MFFFPLLGRLIPCFGPSSGVLRFSSPPLRRLLRRLSLLLFLLANRIVPTSPSASDYSAVLTPKSSSSSVLDNGVVGDPQVDCLEDRIRLTFRTQRPFTGRIFVKGMVENDKCVKNYQQNGRTQSDFELTNGQCNMRRSRKLGPEQRGVEQSITIIISFHDIFITKVDRAYRCTCFYMEADKVVTNRFDVSMIPTTELIDTARMPLCTYTVRRGSVNGPIVTYATVGEPVFHVWSCDSDMFSMLVHNCFVDDGAGKDRKPLVDEHGCTIDPVIVSELTYNSQSNLAYSEVNVFKFADKVTTYFQPPRCGSGPRRRRTIDKSADGAANATALPFPADDPFTMDLAAEKIVVLDLDDSAQNEENESGESAKGRAVLAAAARLGLPQTSQNQFAMPGTSVVCLSQPFVGVLCSTVAVIVTGTSIATALLLCRQRRKTKINGDF
uniref:ZP domain-containing protein n=1 Tax=Globodera rostochiensis TaxID=31243 RepID=A0A914GRY9_GLORO